MYKVKRFSKLQYPNSHRGLGRSLALGGLISALSARSTKKDFDRDVNKGLDEHQIIKNSKRRGFKRGLLGGAVAGSIKGFLSAGPLGALIGAGVGGIIPALAARWGAGKNARSRIKKLKEENGYK